MQVTIEPKIKFNSNEFLRVFVVKSKVDKIKYVDFVSAKTGYNIEKVISHMFDMWNDEGDVYLLGASNAGKSVFYNQLLSSDYCRSIASKAMSRASTSFWPGTTLNMLKFPITFLNSTKLALRSKRLGKDRLLIENIEAQRDLMYEKNHNLKYAELLGIVGKSFDSTNVDNDEWETEIDSTYSLNPETGLISEGENFQKKANLEQKLIKDARGMYKPEFYVNRATFFHDTPGVIDTQEILKYKY